MCMKEEGGNNSSERYNFRDRNDNNNNIKEKAGG